MKKVTYVLVLMFSLVLMSTSCEKEKNDAPIPTVLIGTWNFKSLQWSSGQVTTTCDAILNKDYAYVTLSLREVTATTMILYSDCVDNGVVDNREYEYSFDGKYIDCENGSRKFQFISQVGDELKLKLVSASTNGLPINGIYTFKR